MGQPVRKLIEVSLPLEAINAAAGREKSIRHGHPSTLHLWWARRPLAAARAVIFAQMVDDPSSHPELFPSAKAQEKERKRLFGIIEALVTWENSTNEAVLERARGEIWDSWRRACAANADDPRAAELYDRYKLPAFHDPFAGGGSLPLEAQRLGLEAHASDLNPVAVLINKAMIEIPPMFAGQAPVNPEARAEAAGRLHARPWKGAEGLAEDVRHYGRWMRDEAERRIGWLYPKIAVTEAMARERADLKAYLGRELTVIAWLWARTVKSPNPAFARVDVPLISSFMLSTKPGKEAYVEPVIEAGGYRFAVKAGRPKDLEAAKMGTSAGKRRAFRCVISGVPVGYDYIRAEGRGGRMGARMMAIVAEGDQGRIYLPPTEEMEAVARRAEPKWRPEGFLPVNPRDFKTPGYGLAGWADLFTPRQLVALTTFSDLVQEARARMLADAGDAGRGDAGAYADAVATYLGLAVSRQSNRTATLNFWDTDGENVQQVFARQALPMTWDFTEGNPLSNSTGNFVGQVGYLANSVSPLPARPRGWASMADAVIPCAGDSLIVSTDPPYYDNIGYADLSDFFYAWLRRSLRPIYPDLFATLATPKAEELVATPYRHGGKEAAGKFFLAGMTEALRRLAEQAHPVFPVTIYYAFKQSEMEGEGGVTSSGWDTFLEAVIRAGFGISGTWPMRTELTGNLKKAHNALASSIVLVCRPRAAGAATATRRELVAALKAELPGALKLLQKGNIAPVDLAQAAIGPGMAIYTRYGQVLDAQGEAVRVRQALALINEVLDEALAEQEGDFDADTRWALAWFEEFGFGEGEYGRAETLSKAKNTSIAGLAEAGVVRAGRGKVKLLRPKELAAGWDPEREQRVTAWETTHQLIRALESGGERAAAALAARLGERAEIARELAYRLYNLCERKRRAADALAYNALVQSWAEMMKMARQTPVEQQTGMFNRD